MVRANLLLSCLLAILSGLVETSVASGPSAVPGAFMFEFQGGADTELFTESFQGIADVRMLINRTLFRGTSLQFRDPDSAADKAVELARLPCVKGVHRVHTISLPDKATWSGILEVQESPGNSHQERSDNNNRHPIRVNSAHIMTQVDKLQAMGFTGRGIKVAVVDSGIDYTHPALGGCFGKGCLVSYGTDLVGNEYPTVTKPGPDPKDCYGHGTLVAGIIAAQPNRYGFIGAAPGVELGAFKVFPCGGDVEDERIIDAFYAAHEQKSDIISASISKSGGWSTSLLSMTVSRLVEKGVICVIGAGNNGESGIFFGNDPASAASAITVGSFQNTITPKFLPGGTYTIGPGPEQEFALQTSELEQWRNLNLTLCVVSNDTDIKDDACKALPQDTPDLSGCIALVRRGDCPFQGKMKNLASRGANYVIIYDNGSGLVDIPTEDVEVAAAMVTAEQGAEWASAIKTGSIVTLHTHAEMPVDVLALQHNTNDGGFPSVFSSWGPTWDLHVKPNFGAPGSDILSTYPVANGSYAIRQGTSLSTPLVAGAIALIAEARGTLDPMEIRSILSASSKATDFHNGNESIGVLAPVPQQGAGLIQAFDAAFSSAVLDVASISFNDSLHGALQSTFSIKNVGDADLFFSFRHRPAATVYTYAPGTKKPMAFPNDLTLEHVDLQLEPREFTIQPGNEIALMATVVTNENIDSSRLPVWSGFIDLLASDDRVHSLPYIGIGANMYGESILGNKTNIYIGLPESADMAMSNKTNDLSDFNITLAPDNMTFELPYPGMSNRTFLLPILCADLALGSAVVWIDVVPVGAFADPGLPVSEHLGLSSIGSLVPAPLKHVGRTRAVFSWDGSLPSAGGKHVPEGEYKLIVRSLRFYGDAMKPDDYDTWESPVFRIRYKQRPTVASFT